MGSECAVAPAHAGKCLEEEPGTVDDLDKGVERTTQRKSKKKRRNKRKKGKCADATPSSAPLHSTPLRSPEIPVLSTASLPQEAELSLIGTDSNGKAQNRVSCETQTWGSQDDLETMQAGDTGTAGSVFYERGDTSLSWDDSQAVDLQAPPPIPDASRSYDQAEDRTSTSIQEESLLRVSESHSAFSTRSNQDKGDPMSVKRFGSGLAPNVRARDALVGRPSRNRTRGIRS